MTVRDLIVELEKCPNKDREIMVKVDSNILHRIVCMYIDGYYIVEVD